MGKISHNVTVIGVNRAFLWTTVKDSFLVWLVFMGFVSKTKVSPDQIEENDTQASDITQTPRR